MGWQGTGKVDLTIGRAGDIIQLAGIGKATVLFLSLFLSLALSRARSLSHTRSLSLSLALALTFALSLGKATVTPI